MLGGGATSARKSSCEDGEEGRGLSKSERVVLMRLEGHGRNVDKASGLCACVGLILTEGRMSVQTGETRDGAKCV